MTDPEKTPTLRPPPVPSVQPPAPPLWRDPRFIAAVSAILMAVTSWITARVESRAAERTAIVRSDFGYGAVKSKLDEHDKALQDIAADIRAQRDWMAAYLRVQQVSSPATPTPSAPATIVVAQPGSAPPPRRTLRPLSSSLPPLPTVTAKPAPAQLPDSLNELVPGE